MYGEVGAFVPPCRHTWRPAACGETPNPRRKGVPVGTTACPFLKGVGWWKVAGILMVSVALIGGACGLTEEQQAEKAEERQNGFHCLSAWDGHHDGFEDIVRPRLADPGSMETFETRVAPNDGGNHRIIMYFGAKNAYGGTSRMIAFGTYGNESCDPVLDSLIMDPAFTP